MSEREYIKYNTSIQVASNSGTLQKDDEGNLAAIVELRLPDNIFPAESGKKKVDSVQMLTTKMRISMENTPIAQFDVDEDTMAKLEKLKKGSNAAFITTSQMDLYPYVIKGDNQILPSKSNSAFPSYKSQVLSIDISVWMGEDYVTLDTLYVHPNTPSSFAEDVGRYQEPFQKGGVYAALNHLSNLVVKQYMPVKRENDTVSIFNVGSIEQMLQDGLESAFIYNNTNISTPLQYSIFFISEEAYNNNHFPPVEDNDFTKDDVDVENTLTLTEFGGMKAYFVKKLFGPDFSVLPLDLTNIRYSVKPKVSFTEQKLRISYDTCPFENNIPVLWCNSYVNTFDNPLQLSMRDLYNEYSDGFKPPKRVFSYGVTKNEDNSYFFTLQQSTTNPINIVGNKDLRDTFSCLPWITVNTNTNGFFNSKAKAKYRIKQNMQESSKTGHAKVTKATAPEVVDAQSLRKFFSTGINASSVDSSLSEHCLVYTFRILPDDVNTNETLFNKKYPKDKRINQSTDWGTDEWQRAEIDVTSLESIDELGHEYTRYEPLTTYNTYEHNYETSYPSTTMHEIYATPISSTQTPISGAYAQRGVCGKFNINGRDKWVLYDIPEGQWGSREGVLDASFRSWLPPIEPDFISPPVASGDAIGLSAYWNLPQTGDYAGKMVLITSQSATWWPITYNNVDTQYNAYSVQNEIETLTSESIGDLLFNFLPNVDLDEKGRFYLLDGTTTNLSIGQQEVIEGPFNSLYDITTNTTTTSYLQTIYENWNGTKEGSPYITMEETRYKLASIEGMTYSPTFEYTYELIDPEQPDTAENRTSQRIQLVYVNLDQILNTNKSTLSAAVLRTTRTEELVPITSSTTDHISSSSTSYPEGTTNLPDQYTNWRITTETQTDLTTTKKVDSFETSNEGVDYLTNSSDEYWFINPVYISNDPMYRCIPRRRRDRYTHLGSLYTQQWYYNDNDGFSIFYRTEKRSSYTINQQRQKNSTSVTVVNNSSSTWYGNIRLNFEWDNIPIVVISPIQSIVLTLQGMNVSQEFQPINVAQAGGSSLTSTIPVIENYYSLAQTIRDLHDELVVIKDSYDDQPCYSLSTVDGQARALRLEAHYITKDGRLHQIYIPPNGVFSLQLTFGISYYFTS